MAGRGDTDRDVAYLCADHPGTKYRLQRNDRFLGQLIAMTARGVYEYGAETVHLYSMLASI